jgi:YD repeat-containing protein
MHRIAPAIVGVLCLVACDVKGGHPSGPIDEPEVCDTFSPYAGCTAIMSEGYGDDTYVWTRIEYDDLGREVVRKEYDKAIMNNPVLTVTTSWSGTRKTQVTSTPSDEAPWTTTYLYDSAGNLVREQFSPGTYTIYEYDDPKGRRSRSVAYWPSSTFTCDRTWTDADPNVSYIDDCGSEEEVTSVLLDSRDLEIERSMAWGTVEHTYRPDCQRTSSVFSDLRYGPDAIEVTVATYTYNSAGRLTHFHSEGGPAGLIEREYTYTCGGGVW